MDTKWFICNLHFKLFAFPAQQLVFSEELRLETFWLNNCFLEVLCCIFIVHTYIIQVY